MEYSAIVLSGGKGLRMGRDIPKQYLLLGGKPVLMHSLEHIDSISCIKEVIIVCEEIYQERIRIMCNEFGIEKKIIFARAGNTRQESVFNGLKLVGFDNVILHEAARPFATLDDFEKLIDCPEENVSLTYTIPFSIAQGHEYLEQTVNRSCFLNIQLPQKFSTHSLLLAHEKAREQNKQYTEDAGMVHDLAHRDVRFVTGSNINLKISEPVDLLLGELIYKEYIVKRK